MIKEMYSIKDLKGDFWSPKICENEECAKRDLAMMVREPGNLVSSFPGDFALYRVGAFNSSEGCFLRTTAPEFVCNAGDLVGDRNA